MGANKIKRTWNWYVIWFALYALSFGVFLIDFGETVGVIIAMMLVGAVYAIVLSNGFGLAIAFWVLYDAFTDIWMYHFYESEWVSKHIHGVGTPGFSFERFIEGDIIGVGIGLFMLLHLVLSAKRCKEMGVSTWRALIPIYNPFVLIFSDNERRDES